MFKSKILIPEKYENKSNFLKTHMKRPEQLVLRSTLIPTLETTIPDENELTLNTNPNHAIS